VCPRTVVVLKVHRVILVVLFEGHPLHGSQSLLGRELLQVFGDALAILLGAPAGWCRFSSGGAQTRARQACSDIGVPILPHFVTARCRPVEGAPNDRKNANEVCACPPTAPDPEVFSSIVVSPACLWSF
jgi:hypothetical protein